MLQQGKGEAFETPQLGSELLHLPSSGSLITPRRLLKPSSYTASLGRCHGLDTSMSASSIQY